MTQPHFYNDSFPFQCTDNFQPLDAVYNDYQVPRGQSWPNANEEISSLPLYSEPSYSIEQTHLESSTNHNLIPQQILSLRPIVASGPLYGISAAFEIPPVPPQYTQPPLHPLPTAQYSQQSYASPIPILQPERPAIAANPSEWRNNDMNTYVEEVPKPAKKRKTRTIAPACSEQNALNNESIVLQAQPQAIVARPLEDCMRLFDTSFTAIEEKRRRKAFSAQAKKAVNSVRNVGACIQCKFRKKTCSARRPCPYCARVAGSTALGAQLCYRESPFIDRSMIQYYPGTSRKRIVDFNLTSQGLKGSKQVIYIDGAGPVTYPLSIKALECNTASLGAEDRVNVFRTDKRDGVLLENGQSSKLFQILEPNALSISDLEKWAFEYTYIFAKTKNLNATGFRFGVEYTAQGLPHSDLVSKITRLVSLNFVLRFGIKILPLPVSSSTSPFRTIQAQIDTLLFQSFQATEKSLYQDLQRLIFRSAGSLSRDAVIPVCFCVWQLTRLQCMLASHLSNLTAYDGKRNYRRTSSVTLPINAALKEPSPSSSTNSNSLPSTVTNPRPADTNTGRKAQEREAENLAHGLNLLLCTFEALFRGACPLLLDWNDAFSKELLGNEEVLIRLATRWRRTLRAYREKGHSRRFKSGVGYKKEMADRIRGLLREK